MRKPLYKEIHVKSNDKSGGPCENFKKSYLPNGRPIELKTFQE